MRVTRLTLADSKQKVPARYRMHDRTYPEGSGEMDGNVIRMGLNPDEWGHDVNIEPHWWKKRMNDLRSQISEW